MAPRKDLGKLKKNEKQSSSLSLQISNTNNEIKRLKDKLAYKKARVAQLNKSLEQIDLPEKQPPPTISNTVTLNRRKNPSNPCMHTKLKQRRSKETFDLCAKIHGGTADNTEPTVDGMWETLQRKVSANHFVHKVSRTIRIKFFFCSYEFTLFIFVTPRNQHLKSINGSIRNIGDIGIHRIHSRSSC